MALAGARRSRRKPVVLALAILAVFASLTAVVVGRALLLHPPAVVVGAVAPLAVDTTAVARHLGEAIRFRTISFDAEPPFGDFAASPFGDFAASSRTPDAAAFAGLRDHFAATYPRLHATLTREIIGDDSLLFAWKGSDPSLPPVLLLAHQDVVPVEPGTEAGWAHPPFDGVVADGFVWGRGAMDCKGPLVTILEAVELLVARGYVPKRTVMLAFGHDEEVGGRRGAAKIAETLRTRGVRADLVLDEGQAVTVGIVPGIAARVALVGLAEKGYLSLELAATAAGGHSSTPPPETAASIVAAAAARVQDDLFDTSLDGPVRGTFERLAPEMSFGRRLLFANLWLFAPVVERLLAREPATNALVRTTTAVTMLEGSVKENVLPARARVVVNFRIRPGETMDFVVEHVRASIDDPRVEVRVLDGASGDPSPVSPADGPAFALIDRTIRETFPDAIVAPSLVLGATDARAYGVLSENVYRFEPLIIAPDDRPRLHGKDERVALATLESMVRFYARFLENASSR